ncbi:hypothetical protein V1290_000291 [Bradyrhizobium sp. AZCC 1578]
MTDEEINAQTAHLEGVIAFLRSQLSRSTPPAPAAARKPIAARRWELATRAFRRFPFESHTVRRVCSAHQYAKESQAKLVNQQTYCEDVHADAAS